MIFDEKFAEYARRWVALHPGLTADQVEERYNEIMQAWLTAPATWLDGATPESYFRRYDDPKDLIKLLEEYDKRSMDLPEPLYARIVELGEGCVPKLMKIAENEERGDAPARFPRSPCCATSAAPRPRDLYVELIARSKDGDAELCNMAAECAGRPVRPRRCRRTARALRRGGRRGAADDPRRLQPIPPRRSRVTDLCLKRLREDPASRALVSGLLGQIGDPRAVEPLRELLGSADLDYFTYREVRFAIEELGEDAGPERDFTGDPDYEALRNL